ncbi:hypothetical protein F4775DRAFT_550033 [Biscogniauxia sp. FL1348]|nr:hypothetical protein F4775DRAFT_550033 [Biscogniauxia sp. FL1348]
MLSSIRWPGTELSRRGSLEILLGYTLHMRLTVVDLPGKGKKSSWRYPFIAIAADLSAGTHRSAHVGGPPTAMGMSDDLLLLPFSSAIYPTRSPAFASELSLYLCRGAVIVIPLGRKQVAGPRRRSAAPTCVARVCECGRLPRCKATVRGPGRPSIRRYGAVRRTRPPGTGACRNSNNNKYGCWARVEGAPDLDRALLFVHHRRRDYDQRDGEQGRSGTNMMMCPLPPPPVESRVNTVRMITMYLILRGRRDTR